MYELEEIVVTATRVKVPKEEVAANIAVVTREEIEKMPVSNAGEVLQYVPSVYVEFAGGLGSQTVARIQGSDARQVAVYQDGVPLNQLAQPVTDLSYLPVDTIDRIEVYKGAASSAWGSSLGGVINIITREPDPKKPFAAEIQALYGESDTLKNRGTLSGTTNRLGYLLSLTYEESDGFMEHTEYEQDAIYGKINWEVKEASRLSFVYSYDEGNNADPVVDYPDFWDDIRSKRTYERLLFDTLLTDGLDLTVEGRHHRFDNRIDDVDILSGERVLFNDYEEESWGASARMGYDTTEANRLVLGFDQDWGTYDWFLYTKDYDTRNWALYANDAVTWGNLSLNVGGRYDDNRDFGSELSPSAGAVYRVFGDKAVVRAQVAKGFSAPPSAWVNDPELGNKALEPEVGINYQLGCEIRPLRFLGLELNLFRADIEDLIRYNWDTEIYENIDEVTRQGAEGRISASFDSGVAVSFGGSYVDVRDDRTDKVIKDIPRTLLDISASYTDERMTHSVVGKYVDHNSSYAETRDEVFVFDYLLKVRLPWPEPYGRFDLYGAVHNLTNTSYLYREVFPQPDRWIEGGVNFRF